VRRWGVVVGPLLAVVVYAAIPDAITAIDGTVIELGHAGRATAAMAALMGTWWMTEAMHISATALLPVALFPLLGIATIDAASAPYANPLIFLFLGGFLLALAMQRWGLERRIAIRALGVLGTDPRVVVGGLMVITAVFSMWVSNTATTAMMLPIALSVVDAGVPDGRAVLLADEHAPGRNFARALLIGIAVSASIGGVGTLIGSPPNLFLASFSRDELGIEISFARWMLIGLPLVAILLPIAWWFLTYRLFPPDIDRSHLAGMFDDPARAVPHRVSRAEWSVFVVFCATALAWVFRPLLEDIEVSGATPLSGLSDAGIAVIAGIALFLLPADRHGTRVMDWDTARTLPWGILVLFGGGLSLAAAITTNGVDDYLGVLVEGFGGHPILLIALVTAAVVFLTEMTSNTATAAALIPIVAAVAPALGVHPLALAVPVAVAASLAFMLPVATPPNAIVFGSGLIEVRDLMRSGIRLNLVSIVVVVTVTITIALPVLGVDLRTG